MKMTFENSIVGGFEGESKDVFIVETSNSEFNEIRINSNILELNGNFNSDIKLEKINTLILSDKMFLGDGKIEIGGLNEEVNVQVVYRAGENINLDLLNNGKVEVVGTYSKGKVNIKSENEIEVNGNGEYYEPFIKIIKSRQGMIKVDKGVYEIDFNGGENIEVEFYNIEKLPVLKNINKNTFTGIIGSENNLKELQDLKVDFGNINIQLIYNINFKNGVGTFNIPSNYLQDEKVILEVELKEKYNIKEEPK